MNEAISNEAAYHDPRIERLIERSTSENGLDHKTLRFLDCLAWRGEDCGNPECPVHGPSTRKDES